MSQPTLAALAYAMRPDDYLFPYYRDRALILARGIPNAELALSYFAKREPALILCNPPFNGNKSKLAPEV